MSLNSLPHAVSANKPAATAHSSAPGAGSLKRTHSRFKPAADESDDEVTSPARKRAGRGTAAAGTDAQVFLQQLRPLGDSDSEPDLVVPDRSVAATPAWTAGADEQALLQQVQAAAGSGEEAHHVAAAGDAAAAAGAATRPAAHRLDLSVSLQ